ncbi:Zinc finger BED domain-containing protein RICESLEEPER 2 [Bienertia sinuspersici]
MEQHFDAEFDTHGQPLLGEGEGIIVPTAAVICSTRPKKKARVAPPQGNRRAAIWDHFTFVMELGKDGKEEPYAICKYCQVGKYKAHPRYGTSNAKNHTDYQCHAYKAYIVANPPIVPKFDQKLEGKAFSVTVDNATNMDVMISRLKSDLHLSSPLPCNGKFFHVRCCAHILNLIVQCGLKVVDSSVVKLREAANYIGGSDSRMCKFDECVLHVYSTFTGKLRYDVSTRWNSTYLMMIKVVEARTALDLFATIESDFQFVLTPEDWINFDASNSSDGGAEFAVDAYLNSPLLLRNPDSDFDVLKFWKSQCTLYLVLARMAKDILAIPITSVAPESSSSMGGRVLTKYRSSLLRNHAEAFVTTQNWLFGDVKEEDLEKYLVLMKEITLMMT